MAATHPNDSIDLLSSGEYFSDLVRRISRTKQTSRVLISTMSIIPSERRINQLLVALESAAARGVSVDLAIDAQSFMINPRTMHHRVFYLPNRPTRWTYGIYTTLRKRIDRLEAAGVSVHITNVPRFVIAKPFAGRSHIKLAIIDSASYIGGCNLAGSRDTDFMARSEDPARADWLYATLLPAYQTCHMGEALDYTDKLFEASLDTKILIDAGRKNTSAILSSALTMIDDAEKWIILTCQFFPQGAIAQHLKSAYDRGVDVRIIYNHPRRYSDAFGKTLHSLHKFCSQQRLPKQFFTNELSLTDPYLHAKILATEKGGMIGSHNYASAGVHLGTAEIAIHSKDPVFGEKLRNSVKGLLQ